MQTGTQGQGPTKGHRCQHHGHGTDGHRRQPLRRCANELFLKTHTQTDANEKLRHVGHFGRNGSPLNASQSQPHRHQQRTHEPRVVALDEHHHECAHQSGQPQIKDAWPLQNSGPWQQAGIHIQAKVRLKPLHGKGQTNDHHHKAQAVRGGHQV